MSSWLTPVALGACLFLAAVPVARAAGDQPLSMPAIDATVLYRIHAANHDVEQRRVYFGQHGDLFRVDGRDNDGDTVIDRARRQVTVVINAQRAYLVFPAQGPVPNPFLLDPADTYARAGTTRTIAGLACDDWSVTSTKGHASVCVTRDGIILSASGVDGAGAGGDIQALDVSTAPIPPATFAPPDGYQRLAHPAAQP
jgi:hypothetical protein